MYRAFRPLRGHRLDRIVSGIDDTSMDLRFETSLNTEYGTFGAIVIAAANFGDKLLALILKLEQWREFLDDEIAPWSAVIVDALSLRPWPRPQKSMPSNGSVLAEVQLPAESLVVLTLPLIARHVPTPLNKLSSYCRSFCRRSTNRLVLMHRNRYRRRSTRSSSCLRQLWACRLTTQAAATGGEL